jgi:type I restriction enzyme S subunit
MITNLRPYPAMKDSGIEWLGAVPEHWEVERLRNTAEMRVSNVDKHTKDDEQHVRLCNYVNVYKNDCIRAAMPFMRATASAEEIKRFRLEAGDVLITKDSESWNDIGVPALVEEPANDLICGYHLALLRPFSDRLYGSYLFRALLSTAVSYQFHVEANGVTRYGLSHAAIKSIWLPLPPLPEQAPIVRFIDYVDRRIRRYIRAKQTLTGLLEEQKQAIIHRAVTRGLDPDVPLKPSGVKWLGDIPEHWEVKRLKTIARIRYGLGQPPREASDGLPLIRATNVERGCIVEKDLVRVDPSDVPVSRNAFLREGEIVVVRSGAYTADSAVIPKEYGGAIAGYDMVLTVNRAQPKFIAQVLLCTYVLNDQLIVASMRSAQPHLNAEELGVALILLPPLPEQAAIVEHLNQATADIGTTINRARREIELLHEYRARLIADVVTGKLDVREAAASLPDESEESARPDDLQEEPIEEPTL